MSYGFEATNTNGQILISDKTKNLHFYAKASLISSYNDDINTNGASSTPSSITFTYITDCQSVPVPFFTLPQNNTISVGITRVYGTGGAWYIEILVGSFNGTLITAGTFIPEVYVFSDLTNRPTSIANNNYGMRVFGAGGINETASFDSRYSPLVVAGGYSAAPPSDPFSNSIIAESGTAYYDGRGLNITAAHNGLSYNSTTIINDFSVKNYNNINSISSLNISKPIFCYSAVGQCERDHSFSDTALWDERNYLGVGSAGQFDSTCEYWYMYRSSIQLDTSNNIKCTWLPSRRGYIGGYKRSEYGSSGLGLIVGALVGAVTFGIGGAIVGGAIGNAAFSDAGVNYSYQNGAPPYNNLTLNTNATTVLISDGYLYD